MRVVGLIFAYISLILLLVLCCKPIIKKISGNKPQLKKMQLFLTRNHIIISIIFIISFFLHVILSTEKGFSLYTAKLSLVFLVLSVIFGSLIKIKPKLFLKLHYIFSFGCLIMAILHIIEVNLF